MSVSLPRRVLVATVWAVGVTAVLIMLVAVGWTIPDQPLLAVVAAGAVLAMGLTLAEPVAIPLLAMPTFLVVARVGAGGIDLSISDVALFAAFWPAVLLGRRPYSPPMRALLWLTAVYQTGTLFTVIANPYLANTVEWFHAWLLVGGALVVGWSVGAGGYARAGLSLLLISGAALAAVTVVQGVGQVMSGNFAPVYVTWPYGMHKNFTGTVLGVLALTAYVRPLWLGWGKRWAVATFWLCALGVAFTQSRQAILGLGVALIVVSLRSDPERRRSKLILLAITPAALAVGTLVRDQVAEGNEFNSVFQRLTWFEDTIGIWAGSPWFGEGLRYWTAGRTEFGFQPPNAELEVLASAGAIGLVGFVVLLVGSLVVLWRVDPRYGTLAFSVVLSRFVQGQFDLFWVAIQVSLPFLIAGIALGAHARAEEEDRLGRMVSEARALASTGAPAGPAPPSDERPVAL